MKNQKQNDFEDKVMNNALSKMMDEFDDHYPICQDTHCVFFSKPMMDILREVIREAQEMGKKEGLQALTRMEIESERTAK